MANREQNWGFGGPRGQERGRREDERRGDERQGGWRGGERRAFEEPRGREGGEPWRGQARYGARYDQDRTGYRGQEYGVEGGRDHRTLSERDPAWRGDERETWRPGHGEPYGELELNARNRGIQEFGVPSDYAYHPRAGHEFDPDYLHWREEQMRGHDRDYHEWRKSQQESYDQDYRAFRDQRREHFGRTFSDWRNQRNMVGGAADTGAAPGVGGYGDRVGMPTGYDASAASKPSGMIESPNAVNASPGASQTGGSERGGPQAGGRSGGDGSSEFGKEPPQVRAATDGGRLASDGKDDGKDKETR